MVQCWCIQAAAAAAPRASPPAAGWSVPGLAARGRGWGGGAAPPRLPPAPRPQAGPVLLPAVRWEETRSVFLEELLAIDPIQNNLFYVVGETVLLENFQSF